MEGTNIIEAGFIPAESIHDITKMFEQGKAYEVIVHDKLNPSSKTFAFGINGRLGEYPTNKKIRLLGEEICHLYNCVYREPVTEDSNGYPKIIGSREVCRFSITPTSWGALPERAVLLQPPAVQAARVDSSKAAVPEEEPNREDAYDALPQAEVSVDELMAAREAELSALSKDKLAALAAERGTKQSGTKAEILGALLAYEAKLLSGEEDAK